MVTYTCETCLKEFSQKGHMDSHKNRKSPCKKNTTLETIIEQKVKEALERSKIEQQQSIVSITTMDYSTLGALELMGLCKQRGVPLSDFNGLKAPQLRTLLVERDRTHYKVISLFSGMGGMDVGFAEQVAVHKNSVPDTFVSTPHTTSNFVNLQRLPFETVFQNDILPAAEKVAKLNGWNHNYHMKDIREMLKENFAFPAAHVITGGFPCQDFSHAGKRLGFDSSRGTLYQSYVDLVSRVKPFMFVAENVEGLLTMPGEPIKKIIADFSAVGYEVKYQLIKCEEFGIPQSRHRVIIMGLRLDKRPADLPADWNIISENRRRVALRDYFAHLQEPADSTDPAQQVYSKAARLEKGQGQSEVNLDGAGPTMRAEHHGNIEFRRVKPSKNGEATTLEERRLTVREAALIQTFPPDCKLTETRLTTMAYKPIGNAVPPLLGYLVARKVREVLTRSQVPSAQQQGGGQ